MMDCTCTALTEFVHTVAVRSAFSQDGMSLVEPSLVELQEIRVRAKSSENESPSLVDSSFGAAIIEAESQRQTPTKALQRWNSPRSNMWQTFAAFYSFLVLGLAAAAYGVRRSRTSNS